MKKFSTLSYQLSENGLANILLIILLIGGIAIGVFLVSQRTNLLPKAGGSSVSNISDNSGAYGGQIPKYEKFEVTFDVNTQATNLQMPYDGSAPNGVPSGIGISVDGEFSQDNFNTVLTQPAFYYQDFDYQIKNGEDWIYPKNAYSWKLRFAPNATGNWQYRIKTQDKNGTSTSEIKSFTVSNSSNKGFIKVSQTDSRYFEYGDGTYFPALGYNYGIEWENNPIQANKQKFVDDKQKGVQLLRGWLSQGGFFSGDHNPWRASGQSSEGDSLTSEKSYPGHDVSWWIDSSNPVLFLGWLKKPPAVLPNTNYKISVRYLMPDGLSGDGLAIKRNGWQNRPCDTGQAISPHVNSATGNNWQTLETNFTTGSEDFLGLFCLSLDNVSAGKVYIDEVDIKDDSGVNIVNRPSAALHYNMDQLRSFTFDKILESAHQNDVYFKLVGLEKNDWILNHITASGNMTESGSNDNFYGSERNFTKTRWLEQAWWRYMQARWGYSTNVQSWELLNEGDPFNGNHYALADEFAKYMHSFSGNKHLVTTSFWTEFPIGPFWQNTQYPNLDYADFHQYMFKDKGADLRTDKTRMGDSVHIFDPSDWYDSASAVEKLSLSVGAKTGSGANKPTMRGETGFVDSSTNNWSQDIPKDSTGTWLHKFIWAGINSGGLIESYWFTNEHIKNFGGEYGNFLEFIKDIPLSNGHYIDSGASASDSNLRVRGQKDIQNKRAHIWIDNKTNTWKQIIDGGQPATVNSATVTIPNLPAGSYPVKWYNTHDKSTVKTETVNVGGDGNLRLTLPQALSTDMAVKIGDYQNTVVSAPPSTMTAPPPTVPPSNSPTPPPAQLPKSENLKLFISDFGKTGSNIVYDLNKDGKVDIYDYAIFVGK